MRTIELAKAELENCSLKIGMLNMQQRLMQHEFSALQELSKKLNEEILELTPKPETPSVVDDNPNPAE